MDTKKSILITEEEKLKLHLETSYTERFRILMRLIKLGQKLQNARIVSLENLPSIKQKIPAITGIKNEIYLGEA